MKYLLSFGLVNQTFLEISTHEPSKKKVKSGPGGKKKSKVNVGFLAQEVLAVEQANGYGDSNDNMLIFNLTEDEMRYGLKYERLVPVLVNALKELSTKIDTLETENTALKARVTTLEG